VRALDRALAGAVYNVAGPEPVTVLSALRLLERSLGRPVPVHRLPGHDGEALRTHADISRARRALGWQPHVTLVDGLRCQIDHALSEHGSGSVSDRRTVTEFEIPC
jgi:nucleoside-diphosphate-sugar epimerase